MSRTSSNNDNDDASRSHHRSSRSASSSSVVGEDQVDNEDPWLVDDDYEEERDKVDESSSVGSSDSERRSDSLLEESDGYSSHSDRDQSNSNSRSMPSLNEETDDDESIIRSEQGPTISSLTTTLNQSSFVVTGANESPVHWIPNKEKDDDSDANLFEDDFAAGTTMTDLNHSVRFENDDNDDGDNDDDDDLSSQSNSQLHQSSVSDPNHYHTTSVNDSSSHRSASHSWNCSSEPMILESNMDEENEKEKSLSSLRWASPSGKPATMVTTTVVPPTTMATTTTTTIEVADPPIFTVHDGSSHVDQWHGFLAASSTSTSHHDSMSSRASSVWSGSYQKSKAELRSSISKKSAKATGSTRRLGGGGGGSSNSSNSGAPPLSLNAMTNVAEAAPDKLSSIPSVAETNQPNHESSNSNNAFMFSADHFSKAAASVSEPDDDVSNCGGTNNSHNVGLEADFSGFEIKQTPLQLLVAQTTTASAASSINEDFVAAAVMVSEYGTDLTKESVFSVADSSYEKTDPQPVSFDSLDNSTDNENPNDPANHQEMQDDSAGDDDQILSYPSFDAASMTGSSLLTTGTVAAQRTAVVSDDESEGETSGGWTDTYDSTDVGRDDLSTDEMYNDDSAGDDDDACALEWAETELSPIAKSAQTGVRRRSYSSHENDVACIVGISSEDFEELLFPDEHDDDDDLNLDESPPTFDPNNQATSRKLTVRATDDDNAQIHNLPDSNDDPVKANVGLKWCPLESEHMDDMTEILGSVQTILNNQGGDLFLLDDATIRSDRNIEQQTVDPSVDALDPMESTNLDTDECNNEEPWPSGTSKNEFRTFSDQNTVCETRLFASSVSSLNNGSTREAQTGTDKLFSATDDNDSNTSWSRKESDVRLMAWDDQGQLEDENSRESNGKASEMDDLGSMRGVDFMDVIHPDSNVSESFNPPFDSEYAPHDKADVGLDDSVVYDASHEHSSSSEERCDKIRGVECVHENDGVCDFETGDADGIMSAYGDQDMDENSKESESLSSHDDPPVHCNHMETVGFTDERAHVASCGEGLEGFCTFDDERGEVLGGKTDLGLLEKPVERECLIAEGEVESGSSDVVDYEHYLSVAMKGSGHVDEVKERTGKEMNLESDYRDADSDLAKANNENSDTPDDGVVGIFDEGLLYDDSVEGESSSCNEDTNVQENKGENCKVSCGIRVKPDAAVDTQGSLSLKCLDEGEGEGDHLDTELDRSTSKMDENSTSSDNEIVSLDGVKEDSNGDMHDASYSNPRDSGDDEEGGPSVNDHGASCSFERESIGDTEDFDETFEPCVYGYDASNGNESEGLRDNEEKPEASSSYDNESEVSNSVMMDGHDGDDDDFDSNPEPCFDARNPSGGFLSGSLRDVEESEENHESTGSASVDDVEASEELEGSVSKEDGQYAISNNETDGFDDAEDFKANDHVNEHADLSGSERDSFDDADEVEESFEGSESHDDDDECDSSYERESVGLVDSDDFEENREVVASSDDERDVSHGNEGKKVESDDFAENLDSSVSNDDEHDESYDNEGEGDHNSLDDNEREMLASTDEVKENEEGSASYYYEHDVPYNDVREVIDDDDEGCGENNEEEYDTDGDTSNEDSDVFDDDGNAVGEDDYRSGNGEVYNVVENANDRSGSFQDENEEMCESDCSDLSDEDEGDQSPGGQLPGHGAVEKGVSASTSSYGDNKVENSNFLEHDEDSLYVSESSRSDEDEVDNPTDDNYCYSHVQVDTIYAESDRNDDVSTIQSGSDFLVSVTDSADDDHYWLQNGERSLSDTNNLPVASGLRGAGHQEIQPLIRAFAAAESTKVTHRSNNPVYFREQSPTHSVTRGREHSIQTIDSSGRPLASNEADIESGHASLLTTKEHDKEKAGPMSKPRSKLRSCCYVVVALVLLLSLILLLVLYLGSLGNNDKAVNGIPPKPMSLVPSFSPPGLVPWIVLATIDSASGSEAVSISGNLIVTGRPLLGSVQTFYSEPPSLTSTEWLEANETTSPTGGVEIGFGAAVDVVNERMLVGAPLHPAEGTDIPVGSAFFFVYKALSKSWEQVGQMLRGDDDIVASDREEFGASVSVSKAFRAVVGAPSNDRLGTETGRVYTFEYSTVRSSWASTDIFPIVGESAGDRWGSSISLSKDGSRFLCGAPGNGVGYARLYSWLGSSWQLSFVFRGKNENESFGATVAVLSEDGAFIAIGAPGFDQGTGRIIVFEQRASSGEYIQLGPDIVGESGDNLGLKGSLSGGLAVTGPVIVVSTQNGGVKRFDFHPQEQTWEQKYMTLTNVSSRNAAVAFLTNEASDTLVVVSSDDAQTVIYGADSLDMSDFTSAEILNSTNSPSSTWPIPSPAPMTVPLPSVINSTFATGQPYMFPSTSAPVVTQALSGSWVQSGGPYIMDVTFVIAVSTTDENMAFSASNEDDNGIVSTFNKDISGISWSLTPSQQLFGPQPSGNFGAALDMHSDMLLVGAPRIFADGSVTPTGAAYVYQRSTSGEWVQFGPTLRGESGIYATDELFGSSVSVSSILRVAVGAPGSSADLLNQRGRVYVLEFSAEVSEWILIEDVLGETAGEALGSAVDISASGNFVVVGAPGNGPGYASVLQYNAFSWLSISTIPGESPDEAMGTSVKVLDFDGFIVAAGGPGYDSGRGRVVVYERNPLTQQYTQVGDPIVGEIGDRIGAANMLSGGLSESVIWVVVGTASGQIRRYEFDRSTLSWLQTGSIVDAGYPGLLAIEVSDSSTYCVVCSTAASTVFERVTA